MDIKTLLEAPAAAIEAHWGRRDQCPHADEIERAAAALAALLADIKTQKNSKQLCAKAFAPAKAAGEDTTELKARMQQISDSLTALEQRRKEFEEQLLGYFSKAEATANDATLPRRFSAEVPEIAVNGPITIALACASDAAQWDRYVDAHPRSALYHRYVWRTIVATAFGHESFYWLARDSAGAVRGVLPIVRLRSRLFGDFGVALPFFNYGGAIADNSAIAAQLLEHAASDARIQGMRHLEIRSTQPVGDWPARTDKVSMILRLPADSEQFAAQLGSKLRSQINRARQENAEVCIGHRELLDDFYAVFARNMRDLGTPVYGRNFFATILENLPTQSYLVVLRLHGKPVAAAFLVGDRDLMEIPWASTLRPANALNMNMLLYWEVLNFCIARGYPFFDFGRSSNDSGTFRFKKQWGAQPLQHYWQYWLADGGELPALKPDSPKFRLLIACWRRLPVFVTRLIGPPIVRNLP
jgi:FemAB-related protein (PEP-CTERM system-associated)